MSSPADRFRELVEVEGLKMPWLEAETGISKKRWTNVRHGTVEMRAEEIAAIEKLYPEYGYWLAFGKELPEAGQVSPAAKRRNR